MTLRYIHPIPRDASGSLIRRAAVALVVGSALLTAPAVAADDQPGRWSLRGYGTLAYTVDDDSALGFRREVLQFNDDLDSGSFVTDSRLGIQAAFQYGPKSEFVIQGVLREQSEFDFDSMVEWAYFAFRPTPSVTVRAGRIGSDILRLSHYRNVGFGQTAIRPNVDVYGYLPLYSLDGADITYVRSADDVTWTFRTQLGTNRATFPTTAAFQPDVGIDYDFETEYSWGLTAQREHGAWRTKLTAALVEIGSNIDIEMLIDPLRQVAALGLPGISANASELIGALSPKGERSRYVAIAGVYDDGHWVLETEFSRIDSSERSLPNSNAWYASVGRRVGPALVYGFVSRQRPTESQREASVDWDVLPQGNLLRDAALAAVNSIRVSQGTVGAGVRWELRRNLALKFQVQRVSIDAQGYGLWNTSGDGQLIGEDRSVVVGAVGLDFVF